MSSLSDVDARRHGCLARAATNPRDRSRILVVATVDSSSLGEVQELVRCDRQIPNAATRRVIRSVGNRDRRVPTMPISPMPLDPIGCECSSQPRARRPSSPAPSSICGTSQWKTSDGWSGRGQGREISRAAAGLPLKTDVNAFSSNPGTRDLGGARCVYSHANERRALRGAARPGLPAKS
jgi:hypothetical protein